MLGLFAFGVASTAIIQANGWDLEWSGLFYTPGGIYGGWTQSRERPWDLFYDYGTIPTWIILLLAIGLYVAVLARKAPKKYAKPCLVIILTVALGPGLLVNGILKPYWGPATAGRRRFPGRRTEIPQRVATCYLWCFTPGQFLHLRPLRNGVRCNVCGCVLPHSSYAFCGGSIRRDCIRNCRERRQARARGALCHGRHLVGSADSHARGCTLFPRAENCREQPPV